MGEIVLALLACAINIAQIVAKEGNDKDEGKEY